MNEQILDKSKRYLVAVSGGSDSMALLHMLISLGYDVMVGHVNYHTREASNFEEEMVKEFCHLYNVPSFTTDAYFPKQGNFENWARVFRYEFFKKCVEENSLEGCLVAHHQDDLLETYLLQKNRGYVSFYGLKDNTYIKDVRIIRPLLDKTKDQLEQYCKDNHLPYSHDISNDDVTYERNRIRHEVLAKMSEEKRANLLEEIKQENLKLEKYNVQVSSLLNEGVTVSALANVEEEIADRVIFEMVNNELDITLSQGNIREIKNIIFNKEGNTFIDLGKDTYLLKEYDSLKIVKKDTYNYEIRVDSPCVIENEYVYFDFTKNPGKFYVKEDSYPLTITIAKKDDLVKIGTIHKSVNRILIDAKIPYLQRLYWPKIVNNKGKIIFVPRTSEDDNGDYLVKKVKSVL